MKISATIKVINRINRIEIANCLSCTPLHTPLHMLRLRLIKAMLRSSDVEYLIFHAATRQQPPNAWFAIILFLPLRTCVP